MSTMEGIQYRGGYHPLKFEYHGGYHDTCGEYHEYREGCSIPRGTQITKDFPHGTHDISHVHHDIPHGTEHPPRYSR